MIKFFKSLRKKMPRKNSNIKFLTNTLNSPKSTPEKIKNAFFKYIEHTKNFYGRQLYQNKISNAEYSDNIELIDALSDRINLMFIKIKRLEGRNRRLEKKEIYLQAEINLLRKENKDLIKENETLKMENEAIKSVISHSAEIYRNNEVQYESTINNLRHTLCKIIEDIILRCQEYNIGKVFSLYF